MLSLLPSRVLRLMEFLGFSGDRVSVDLAQPCGLFWTLLFPTVISFEHAYHFPGARFVRAETGGSKQQPAVNSQHLDSPHVSSLHYRHPGWSQFKSVVVVQCHFTDDKTKIHSVCLMSFFPQVLVKQTYQRLRPCWSPTWQSFPMWATGL